MEKFCLSAIIIAALAFSWTSGDKTHVFRVAKRLENGDIIPLQLQSQVTIYCPSFGHLLLTVHTPTAALDKSRLFNYVHSNEIYIFPDVNVYLANEDKNILQLNLCGSYLIGYKYETPFGKKEILKGPLITKENGKFSTSIPRKWIPVNVTRISASVETGGEMYNYYGIFNRPISIEDTMVVEEFRKVSLC